MAKKENKEPKSKQPKEPKTTKEPKVDKTKEEVKNEEVLEAEGLEVSGDVPVEEVVVNVIKNVTPAPSMKQMFDKSIQITPFALFQNGMMICRWKQNVNIETFEDGFVINNVKYSYSGIEIKYV